MSNARSFLGGLSGLVRHFQDRTGYTSCQYFYPLIIHILFTAKALDYEKKYKIRKVEEGPTVRDSEQLEINWGNESLATIASRLTVERKTRVGRGARNSVDSDDLEISWGDSSDLTTLATRLTVDKETRTKSYLAKWIFGIFAVTLFVLLGGGVLTVALRPLAESEQALKNFVSFLQAVENFVSKIFSPLLAFVLGYYFASDKSQKR